MTTAPAATEQKPKVDLGILEEDDEFEEFPTEGTIFFTLLLSLHLRTNRSQVVRGPVPTPLEVVGFRHCSVFKFIFEGLLHQHIV